MLKCATKYLTKAVDTEKDLDLVCKMMKKDKLYKIYKTNEDKVLEHL